jgi:hypothetical protein
MQFTPQQQSKSSTAGKEGVNIAYKFDQAMTLLKKLY